MPNSPLKSVVELSPEGGLNRIGPAIAGATTRSRHDNVARSSTTVRVFITAQPFFAKATKRVAKLSFQTCRKTVQLWLYVQFEFPD